MLSDREYKITKKWKFILKFSTVEIFLRQLFAVHLAIRCKTLFEVIFFALDRFSKAERHLKMGESDLAKNEAQNAATSGLIAITLLLREEDKKTFSIALDETLDSSFLEWEKVCYRPEDYIAKARKLLRHYSNLSPPENKLPFT